MSRKTTAALVAALGINFAMAGGAMMLANMNKPAEYDSEIELASAGSDIGEVASIKVDLAKGDLAIALNPAQTGGNTRVTFNCGKTIPTGREEHEGTWDQVAGAVLYRPDTQQLLALEAKFDVRSLRTDDARLTKTVTEGEKWFDYENHPVATFVCSEVNQLDAATTSHTHDLIGSFTLNGITLPLAIPCKLGFSGESLVIEASFSILRSDYKVDKRDRTIAGSVGGTLSTVDDEVRLTVRVNASPDPSAQISELAQLVESQQEALRIAGNRITNLEGITRRIELLEEKADRIVVAPPVQVENAAYPASYVDELPAIGNAVPFDMVLVPGDSDAGLSPFYMSKHEVTWKMLRHWMEGFEVGANEGAALIAAGLQPSIVHGVPSGIIQVSDAENPAMGMTLLTAQSYCKWLSEQTGRKYRLPTIVEWQYALRLGGGVPDDISEYAWHAENSPEDQSSLMPKTSPAGQKKPNTIGLYDMLGSVAEWVTNTGTERIVVGGSIFNKPEEITADWRAVEDVEVWAASHPQLPYSRFWYNDFYVTGIRLVCEPASVAANPPKPSE